MRRHPLEQRHLVRVEIGAAALAQQAERAPLLPAHGTESNQVESEPERADDLPPASGPLELAPGHVREQCHRNPVLDHPPLLVPLFLEEDVLKVGAVLALT